MKKVVLYVANRFWVILAIYVTSILIAAGLFGYFENKAFGDSLWWSVITALTIGYGDYSPVTMAGRVTGILFGHFWIFGIIPLIIGNIICQLLEDKNKFTHEEQEWQERTLRAISEKLGIDANDAPPDF